MHNHIHFQYDYLVDTKTINSNLKIGPDEYTSSVSLGFYDKSRLDQIIKIYEKIKHLFDSHIYIVKNFTFLFENSDFMLKYQFSNYNNNLNLSFYNSGMWLYSIDFICKVPKNSNTVDVDNLSSILFHSKI